MLEAWTACFGDRPVTTRRLLADAADLTHGDLMEVLHDLPVTEGKDINRNKLGWYLKKQCGRITRGLMLERGDLLERNSWRVVAINDESNSN